jgi:flagellar basal body-associated protein FliL
MAEGQGEGEGEALEEEKKKGGAKKLIIKIVPLLLIALVIAKMTVLKPPPPTAAQVAEKAAATKLALETKCALANDMTPPKAPAPKAGATPTPTTSVPTTPTTKLEPVGPVLELDSKTMNLDASHFLKIGISLQLPAASIPDDVKLKDNWGSVAGQLVLDTFSGRTFAELSNDALRKRLQQKIGQEMCLRTEGSVVTVYFIDFVMQ